MEAFELILLLLAAVLLSSAIDQIIPKKTSLPLIQIAFGLLIALFSVSPIEINVDPELFLILFIAPLLFYEAKKIDKVCLWKNKKPVLSLAIGLVIVSMLIIGFCTTLLIPSIPLAAAFALGAALGPTDAVAVSSLSKQVNFSSRQKNILEGESLINDASGVVAFQFAIAAVVTGTFSLVDASVSFLIEFFGGIAVGLLIAFITKFVLRKARDWGLENTTFHVLLEIFLPFIVYLVSHGMGVSGILAVVAAGLTISMAPKKMSPIFSRLNIVSTSVWRVISFSLNGIVFVLLGAQLPTAMRAAWENGQIDNFMLLFSCVAITLLLLLIRFIWILIMDIVSKKTREKGASFSRTDIRSSLVATLAGPKGAITLSVMLTIPFFIFSDHGVSSFPYRSTLLFIASGVIILTLLCATFIVPLLAPKKVVDLEKKEQERETLLEILRNVIEELTSQQTPENRIATQKAIRSYNARISHIKENNDTEIEENKELRIKALRWEQEYILEMIENDEVGYREGYQLLNRLARVKNLILHRNDKSWLFHNFARHFLGFLRSIIRHIGHLTPTKSPSEQTRKFQEIQIKATEYVIKKLRNEISNPEAPTEDVSTLLLEYQQVLTRIRNPRPSVSAITKNSQKAVDATRLGLELELEQIQTMYEAERLSRASAKRLRENVLLMQIDLEESL